MLTKTLKHLIILLFSLVSSFFLFYYYFDDFIMSIIYMPLVASTGLRILFALILYIAITIIIDRKIDKIRIDVFAGIYLMAVLCLSLLRTSNPHAHAILNPLDIIDGFHRHFNHTLIILIGNLIIYVPLGIYMKYRFNLSNLKLVICFLPYIVLLELTQLISKRGIFDIDDIISNTAGFVFGGICFGISKKYIQRKHKGEE